MRVRFALTLAVLWVLSFATAVQAGPGFPCPTPTCNIGGQAYYIGTVGSPVTFYSTGSAGSPGHPIVSYAWDFGDGTTGTGIQPNHVYAAAGTYQVKMTVTNDCGGCCTCRTVAIITNPPGGPNCPKPICNAGGPYIGIVGVPVALDGTGSSGPPPETITTYHWDFGDSTGFYGATPTHTYTAPGVYIVTLTVTNSCCKKCSCTTTVTITNTPNAPPPCRTDIKIAQVYPAVPVPAPAPFGPLGCFVGGTIVPFTSVPVPGVLCLDTLADNKLNVNAFISCCPGGTVDLTGVKLVKTVPGSELFPGCYQPYTVTQVGRDNIRTWWSLNFTMPGTTFCLTLDGVCNTPGTPGGGGPKICPRHKPGGNWRSPCNCKGGTPGTPGSSTPYQETWCWEVTANPETFLLLLDLFHLPAVGFTEVPCIMDEAVYDALVVGAKKMKEKVKDHETQKTAQSKQDALDAINELIVLVLANTLSADWLDDADEVVNFPPGNFLPIGAGILNTCETPCACKLLADLEFLQKLIDKSSPL